MARKSLYLLHFVPQEQRYTLTGESCHLAPEVITSRHLWEAWLNTVTSFAFEDRWGKHCTLRKERLQRGDAYWYAYRSIHGQTKKRYLGKTHTLTIERLEDVSARFLPQENMHTSKADFQRRPERMIPDAIPLLETKLHPPQVGPSLIQRPRLLERLDATLVHKLTVIRAPAGSGKTTQVNQWLDARGYREGLSTSFPDSLQPHLPILKQVAWLSLDAGDNDPLRFWRYIITACQKLLGQEQHTAAQMALSLLTTALPSPFDLPPIELALTQLLNALADPSSGGLLILDDYHLIREEHIHKMLTFLIDHLPLSTHVLLLSRTEPELPLLRWRARGELYELRRADLRFSFEETTTFFQQTLPIMPSTKALDQLEKSLEGWPAGLRLLCLTLSGWQTSQQVIEQAILSLGERADIASPGSIPDVDAPRRNLFDYFVTELLETQPEPIQRFLLHTSVLSRLCPSLCNAVMTSQEGGIQLKEAARSGLFLETMAGPGGWYAYHPLFAEAMRREARRRLGDEALRACSLRASFWYEREALLTEAIEAAQLAHDMEHMAGLIEIFNEQHFYEPYTLLHWLEQLPETVLQKHPILCLLFATELDFPAWLRFSPTSVPSSVWPSLLATDHTHAETLLAMAEEGWRHQENMPWIGAIWAHRAIRALMYHEPSSSVVTYAHQALALLGQKRLLDRRLLMYRSACLLFVGTEKLRLGKSDEALQVLLQAQKDQSSPGNKFLAVDIHLMLGKSYLVLGKRALAQQYLLQTLAEAKDIKDDNVIVNVLLELAWLAFEAKDIDDAQRQLDEAQESAQRLHPPLQEAFDRLILQDALLQHERGETQAALAQLQVLATRLSVEQPHTDFWLTSQLHDWQERLQTEIRRARRNEHGFDIHLSPQEERVLRLLATGASNQKIAQELVVSVNTVKYHVKHLYQKLGVSNRLQASQAARHLLIDS